MKHSETNSFNTFSARRCFSMHIPFSSSVCIVWAGKRLNAHVFIQTKPFCHPNTWTTWKKRSVWLWRVCVTVRIYWSRLAPPFSDCARIEHFSEWIYVCMYHSFMLERVKQYLARNSNAEHRISCSLSLVARLFAYVLSMLPVAISCLVGCQNALITHAQNTSIFFSRSLVSLFFLFVHFLVARLHSMRISFVWVCAWLLRAM